jgi:pilus assembly protein Flp/PilA
VHSGIGLKVLACTVTVWSGLTLLSTQHIVRPRRDWVRELCGKEVPQSMFNALIALINRDEEGQGLAEYALILALIAIVAIVALIFLGNQVSTILSTVGDSI